MFLNHHSIVILPPSPSREKDLETNREELWKKLDALKFEHDHKNTNSTLNATPPPDNSSHNSEMA